MTTAAIRRGEFYRWEPVDDRPRWVLVLSDDTFNATAWPICAHVVRGREPSLWLVPLAETDPIAGCVALFTLGGCDPDELSGPHGMISGTSFQPVLAGLRIMFDI